MRRHFTRPSSSSPRRATDRDHSARPDTAGSMRNDLPRLTSTANALATTLDTVLTHINQLAAS